MVNINESRTACQFTPGRNGSAIDKIIIHHWGADGQNHDDVVDFFCNPAKGAQTSAHFVVSAGRVHCIVSPTDTAWHAGDWNANLTSIGIECRPEATAADYATVAELIRWLRAQYGDLPLHRHQEFTKTDCPGRWDLARLDRLARNTAPSAADGAMRPAPDMYPITQRYNQNATAFNSAGMHGALDYGVPPGTPLVAPEDGVVVFDGWAWDLPGGPDDWHLRWYLIKPARGDTKGGGGIITIFRNAAGSYWGLAHASQSFYNVGDRVKAGQVLQLSGCTGISTGPHSHVNLWPANPNWGNGAYGAIDPEPWITRGYSPTTYTAWQGSATTGTGAASKKKDWFNMATKEELRLIVREEIIRNFQNAEFTDINGKKQTVGQVWRFRTKKVEDTLGAIAKAVSPSTIALAVWAYKSKLNGTKDAYQLLTDVHNNTPTGSTKKEA